jgi:hypothetical protein
VTMLKRSEKNRSERDHLELRLSRIADADGKFSTRIDATAHRREVSGRDIRRIRLHPRAGADPSSAPAASEPPPCWVACDLECSGDASVASCRDRCSAALALEAPQCGAPSEDFQLPTRLHDQRQAITSSGGLGDTGELDDVCRRSQLHDEADDPCRQIVDSLTGSWTIHGLIDDDSAVTLVLGESTVGDPGSVELLVGSVTTGGRALPAVASVSNSGSWYVRAANVGTHGSLVPAFPPFLLVGGAHDSPRATAVGVTLGATARKLRATRRMAANSASAPASAGAQRPGAPLSAPASPPTVGRKTVSREPMPSSTGKPSLKPKRPPRQ